MAPESPPAPSENGGQPEQQGKPPLGRSSNLSTFFKPLLDVVLLFLPGYAREIFHKGLLRPLAFLVFMIAVLPLLMAFLAGFWLKQLGHLDIAVIKNLRLAYLEIIQDGFSFEEVASRSNARLDYFQWFEADLPPNGKTFKEFPIIIQPRQKASISVKTVTYKAETPNCSLPEEEIDLVSVFLGEQLIKTVKELTNSNFTIEIGKNWWARNMPNFDSDEVPQRLSFKLTDEAKKLPQCGRVHVEGSVSLFKDLLSS
jgi:hypothetical protein